MFSTIKNYIGVGMAVSILLLTAYNWQLRRDNEELIARVGVEVIARKTAESRLEESVAESKEYYEDYLKLRKGSEELSLDLLLQNKKLEEYKRREHIAIKKPKLIERLANRATVKLFNAYACTTGNSEACPSSED